MCGWRNILLIISLVAASCADAELEVFDTIGGDFELEDQYGNSYRLSDHNGKIRVLFFGFTYCPDICPTTLGEITEVWGQLSADEQQQIEILFVSVDPQRDSAELLKRYLDGFELPVLGLRGSEQEIRPVVEQYASFYERVTLDSALEYTIDHSSQTFVIDKNGQIRGWVKYDQAPAALLEMLRQLL
ncbi:MAG: SCO family protein [Planctomycetota bacterium]|jgi:protein SCO1/2|nr:SCO family protein [Planctomycetota bacterium]